MKKIVVISALLSLTPGCAGSLKLDTGSLFTRKTDGSSAGASEGAAGSSGASNSGGQTSAASAEPAVDPAEERRAFYQKRIDKLDALLSQFPDCCQGDDFLIRMSKKYSGSEWINNYRDLLRSKLARTGESKTPEWQAVEAKYKEIEDALFATVRMPEDRYKGKDAKELKKAYSEYAAFHTKMPVLQVALVDEDWDRSSGSRSQGNALINFDEGFLSGLVLLKNEAGNGEVWQFIPRKDYLNNGKVTFDVFVPTKIADMKLPEGNS